METTSLASFYFKLRANAKLNFDEGDIPASEEVLWWCRADLRVLWNSDKVMKAMKSALETSSARRKRQFNKQKLAYGAANKAHNRLT